jgi:hypothetical protein
MPKLGEAAQRSERFAFLDFDYGAITQVRQVFPGRQLMFEPDVETTSRFQSERRI